MAKRVTAKARHKATKTTAARSSTPPSEALLTRRALALALSAGREQPYHPMTVTKWEQDGMPVAKRGGPGRPSFYRETDVRAWLSLREELARTASGGTLNVHQERARREKAQAELAEQTFQMRSRELLPAIEVERVWEAEILAVRTTLLGIPATFAERVYQAATTEGVAGVERMLTESVHGVLRELAGAAEDHAVSA